MIKTINFTFLALIISMIIAFAITEIGINNGNILISLFAILKFLLVGFFFMSLKSSHLTWKIVLLFFGAVYFTTIVIFY